MRRSLIVVFYRNLIFGTYRFAREGNHVEWRKRINLDLKKDGVEAAAGVLNLIRPAWVNIGIGVPVERVAVGGEVGGRIGARPVGKSEIAGEAAGVQAFQMDGFIGTNGVLSDEGGLGQIGNRKAARIAETAMRRVGVGV